MKNLPRETTGALEARLARELPGYARRVLDALEDAGHEAALHRLRLAPLMDRDANQALPHLKRSLVVEFGLGLAVLAVVAVMGTLPPPASL